MKIRPVPLECYIAGLVAIIGLLTIVSALLVRDHSGLDSLHQWAPWYLPSASPTISVVAGAFLIVLASGLWRRKQQAWAVTLALLVVSMMTHLVKGPDAAEGACAAALFVLLAVRRRYIVGSDHRSIRRGCSAFAAALALLAVYTGVGLALLRGQFGGPGLQATVDHGVNWLFVYGPLMPSSYRALWILHSIVWLSGALLLYGLVAILRPVPAAVPAAEMERRRASDAVTSFGLSAISPYALESDKAVFVGPHDSGIVAFAVASGVAVTAGDPIGPDERREELLDAFLLHCQQHGWTPAFYQILPQEMGRYHRRGLRFLKIGEDALIDLPSFTLSGKKIANVRHCVTHCERAGLTIVVYDRGVVDESALDALAAISTSWLSGKTGGEMSFSLGSFNRETLRRCPVAVASDNQGQPVAFATFRRYGGQYGVALDLMRRAKDRDVPSGTMDYLIARALEHFKGCGIAVASLGLAPLANTRDGADGWLAWGMGNGMDWVFNNLNGIYRYKSLYFFKRKFNPSWEPRYLAYPGTTSLPQVLYALVRVHLPGALVALPAWIRRPRSEREASVALRTAREGAEG